MSIRDTAMQKLEEALEETTDEAAPDGGAAAADIGTPEGTRDEPLSDDTDSPPDEAASSADEEAAEAAADAAEDALPDDATDEEREAARDEAREDFFVGRYKTREDAEQGIAEQKLTIDRLNSERNQLTRELEETRAARQEEPQEIDLPTWDAWAQEQVEAGIGEQAALQALEHGGYAGWEVLMKHWLASEDPQERAQATIHNNGMIMEIASARAAAAANERANQPTEADLQAQAHSIAKQKYPDIDDFTAEMSKVVTEMPEDEAAFLKSLIDEKGVAGRAQVLRMVYLEAKNRDGGAKVETAKAERQRRRVSEDRATTEATTSSSEGTRASRTPPPAAEAYAIERKRGLRERQSLPQLEE